MKQNMFIFFLATLLLLNACSNALEPTLTHDNFESQEEISEQRDSILSFTSVDEYNQVCDSLATLSSESAKLSWMKNNYPHFYSIQNLYWDAMQEIAAVDNIDLITYNQFNSKYSQLYFPREEDDAGFYIPIRNENQAFVANTNCLVKIANRIVNLRDINSYEDLMESGKAYYASTPMTIDNSEFVIINRDMDPVGPVYESGWINIGDRRILLKATRHFKADPNLPSYTNAILSLLRLEFCFRKKTWVGWVNFSATSTTTFIANLGSGWGKPVMATHDGFSSHDSELTFQIHHAIVNNKHRYYYPQTQCQVTTNLSGLSSPYTFSFTMPYIYCQYNDPITINPVAP